MKSTAVRSLLVCMLASGCQGSAEPPGDRSAAPSAVNAPATAPVETRRESRDSKPQPPIPTISLSGTAASASDRPMPGGAARPGTRAVGEEASARQRRDVLEKMKPLQILLGDWHGTTQKEFGDFKALDAPRWVWDFLTDKEQPALVMSSTESPYFRSARLTFLPDRGLYRMQTVNGAGETRTFEGRFSRPVEEFQGDDRRMHRRYKLQLTQVDAESPRDAWQVVFNQQDNNRYLVELSRRRGSGFLRFDTIATQREGTSFARSDEGYGERECIISGGLGTIPVSYQGKSYVVCCTGCKAAFEEDPASWIAEYEAKKTK